MLILGKDAFDVPVPRGMASFSLQQKILPVAGRCVSVFVYLLGGKTGTDITTLLEQDIMGALPVALPGLGQVFSEMPEGELEKLTKSLLGGTKVRLQNQGAWMPLFDGPGGDLYDQVMQGRTMETWKLLWHALGVWYPDFFALAGGLRAKGAKGIPSGESTTSEPSGPAGA